MVTAHATCIAIDGHGILLRGPSGSGKSDLALRAIAEGAHLVADDQVLLALEGDAVIGSAPPALHGLIEIRGLGLMRMNADARARIALVAEMAAAADIDRMPDARRCRLAGADLPVFELDPFQASAPAKLRFALAATLNPELLQR
jgi:serine kinase of HPr protein (carbohydrate metabolism regulator)